MPINSWRGVVITAFRTCTVSYRSLTFTYIPAGRIMKLQGYTRHRNSFQIIVLSVCSLSLCSALVYGHYSTSVVVTMNAPKSSIFSQCMWQYIHRLQYCVISQYDSIIVSNHGNAVIIINFSAFMYMHIPKGMPLFLSINYCDTSFIT